MFLLDRLEWVAGRVLLLTSVVWGFHLFGQVQAGVLTDAGSFTGAAVVADWHELGNHHGEDGPVMHEGLQIESLINGPYHSEIGGVRLAMGAGFVPLGASGDSVLRAGIGQTDFVFTFPARVERAGIFVRDSATFAVQALDSDGAVLESTALSLSFPDLVGFRGFEGLVGMRAIRVFEIEENQFVTDFDDVQWTVVPEPGAFLLACFAMLLVLVWPDSIPSRLMRHGA